MTKAQRERLAQASRRQMGTAPMQRRQTAPSQFNPARRKLSREQWLETRRLIDAMPKGTLSPFLGDVDPMADRRVQGYTVVERGRLVRVVGHPC